MNKFVFVILLIIASAFGTKLNAQFDSYVTLNLVNNHGTTNSGLACGILNEATNGLDTALGEYDYPGHPFQQFSAYFTFSDYVQYPGDTTWYYENYFCKKDFREIPDKAKFIDTFNLDVQWGQSDDFTISWNFSNKSIIDSAKIQDRAGFVYVVDMFKENSLKIDNNLVKKISVIIYYNKNKTGIVDKVPINVKIYPNPTIDFIKIESEKCYIFELFDNNGVLVKNGNTGTGEISLGSISAGAYSIVLYDDKGIRYITRLIKE